MTVNIAWGITGASQHMAATFDVFREAVQWKEVRITTFLTAAGVEIVRMLGLWDDLQAISPGGPYRELLTPRFAGVCTAQAVRFINGEYELFVVAPATTNTMAKIVAGISDTSVTNAVAWAHKSNRTVFVLCTHADIREIDSPFPYRIRLDRCRHCDQCPPVEVCATGALTRIMLEPMIDPLYCTMCGECVPACPHDAVERLTTVRFKRRLLDAEVVESLRNTRGTVVLDSPEQLLPTLRRYATRLPALRVERPAREDTA